MDKVSAAFLRRYAREIDAATEGLDPAVPAEVVRDAVGRGIEQRLQLLVPRVFVVEFHEFRRSLGLPVDATSDAASRRYTEAFDADTVAGWARRHPVFGDLVDTVVAQTVVHVREIADRFTADRDALVAAGLLLATAAPVAIEHLGSDAHHQGRMVAAVRLSDGTRIVYKPRSLGAEVLTRRCLGLLSADVGADLSACVPESLDRGTHGWQREVVRRDATTDADVTRYYRTFGAVTALMTVLGATDMHHENVVAVGDHPVLIDLETVLHSDTSLVAGELPTALSNRVKLSVASTVLLPQRLPTGPYSVLMAGIGVPFEQESERTDFVLVDRDTDAVDIARRTFRYRHTANVLHDAQGRPTDVLDHGPAFLGGFRDGYRAVIRSRTALTAELTATPVAIRQIFRSTAVYGRILNAATHPDNLGDRSAFERVVGMLHTPPGYDRPYVRQFLADAERAALAVGDVPYFSVRSDDVRLTVAGHTSVPYCDLSPVDRARTGLAQADEDALAFEELIVEEGLSELRRVRFRHDPEYRPAPDGPFTTALSDDGIDVDVVVDRLRRVAVSVDGLDGPEVGWVGGAHGPDLATYDPGTCISLHDAGGMVVLFDRIAASGSADARSFAAAVRRGLVSLRRRYREPLAAVPLSVASGPFSVDYALNADAPRLPAVERAVAQALAGDGDLAVADLMKGLPGAGLLLAGFPDTPADVLDAVLRATPAAAGAGKGPWDLAHGDLGVTWARYRMLRRLDRVDEARAVACDLAAALDRLPDDLPRAWCSGYGGLVLVAAELAADADLPLTALVRRASALPPAGRPVDLSVCHGVSGVVQSLLRLAATTGSDEPLSAAAELWQAAAAHARRFGYCTGDPEKQGLLGYFLGWSGIADTGLQLRAALAGRPAWGPTAFTRRPAATAPTVPTTDDPEGARR